MNVGLIIIIFITLFILIKSIINKKKKQNKYPYKCFIDKLLSPLSIIYELWHPNDVINVDYVKEDGLLINSELKHIFILKIKDFKDLDSSLIHELYKKYSTDKNGFFYQAILKDGEYQKQYIFSYSKELLEIISHKVKSEILSGEESLKVLKKVLFADKTKEKLNINTAIQNTKKELSSKFEVFQGYKAKDGYIDDTYQKLKNAQIKGVIWGYYDFYQGRINGYIKSNLSNHDFFIGPKELVIINFILISQDITKEEINKISNIYNISLVKKSINSSELILKTPLKYRDVEWDLLVNLDYLSSQFIAKG